MLPLGMKRIDYWLKSLKNIQRRRGDSPFGWKKTFLKD